MFLGDSYSKFESDYEYLNHNGVLGSEGRIEGKDFSTWCTTSVAEQLKCENLVRNITLDKGLFGKDFIELKCKQVYCDLNYIMNS